MVRDEIDGHKLSTNKPWINGRQVEHGQQARAAGTVTAILEAGLRINAFAEHRAMSWKALPSLVQSDNGWVLPEGSAQIPLMFSVIARQP